MYSCGGGDASAADGDATAGSLVPAAVSLSGVDVRAGGCNDMRPR